MKNVPEIFGSLVFNDKVMKQKLPAQTFKLLKKTVDEGLPLNKEIADTVANAMKDWALEHGATHFTHWFQPMTGVTAEKHDSFIEPTKDGGVIMEFSGKCLVKGESDASSFPSGGLRATFEARGYTAWDPTSYAFVKEGTLYIPTVFYSYSGEVLDKKTPLLRSMQLINKEALRILKLFGNDATQVTTTVGAEQEYFLVDREIYKKRPDLLNCGRTLIGAKPPKGQDLEDHYYGSIAPRVVAFMADLDETLWRFGVLAKTKHNEVAPAQHEMAPVFTQTNTACDQNQLMMECMKMVARRHNMACLLHEKPFAGVNGSGKHNNWSMSTDNGANLFDPGSTPSENAQFLLLLTAVIKALDEYQDCLRLCVATAGNDHRLGANEAPPAIMSMFIGEELESILESIESGKKYSPKEKVYMQVGVDALPQFRKDTTDRNRTSPFAFTGNKFEFRMVGSSASIAGTNFVWNTMVADVLREFADQLEKATDFNKELNDLISKTYKKHKRIVFNGNNYSDDWKKEAQRRGLSNHTSTVQSVPRFSDKKNVDLFERHNILTKTEIVSREEILLDNYCKVINIEALTLVDMVKQEIVPAVVTYTGEISEMARAKQKIGLDMNSSLETKLLTNMSALGGQLQEKIQQLDEALLGVKSTVSVEKQAEFFHDKVLTAMNQLREVVDKLESVTAKKYWPYPTYTEILTSCL